MTKISNFLLLPPSILPNTEVAASNTGPQPR